MEDVELAQQVEGLPCMRIQVQIENLDMVTLARGGAVKGDGD